MLAVLTLWCIERVWESGDGREEHLSSYAPDHAEPDRKEVGGQVV